MGVVGFVCGCNFNMKGMKSISFFFRADNADGADCFLRPFCHSEP